MRFENNLSTTSGLETSALTRRRAVMSWALAVVIRRSTHRRSSLARASVVVMRPLSSSDVHNPRISALREFVSRLKRRPLFWCLNFRSLSVVPCLADDRGPHEIADFVGWSGDASVELAPKDRAHLLGLDEVLLDQLFL